MKRTAFLAAAGLGAVAVWAPAALPGADASTTVLTIPAGAPVSHQAHLDIEACIGEDVVISGTARLVIHETVRPGGDSMFVVHANAQGAQATGVVTGTVYTFAASDTTSSSTAALGSTFTHVASFNVIGRGQALSWMVHALFHVTVNAQGEVTAVMDVFDGTCA